MFWELPLPSSGAYNCISSLWFYRWSMVGAALLVVVWQTTTNNAALLVMVWQTTTNNAALLVMVWQTTTNNAATATLQR
jgi:hypothetical protein